MRKNLLSFPRLEKAGLSETSRKSRAGVSLLEHPARLAAWHFTKLLDIAEFGQLCLFGSPSPKRSAE